MNRFLDWPPILWTLRIGILIVVIGGLHVFLLLVSRFFRWKNIRAMLLADPPRVESLGGEFAGAKAELKLFQRAQDVQLGQVEQRMEALEAEMRRFARAAGTQEQPRGMGDE